MASRIPRPTPTKPQPQSKPLPPMGAKPLANAAVAHIAKHHKPKS